MNKLFFGLFLFFSGFISAQNKIYTVSTKHLFLADESKISNTADSKIKLKFSSLDNGNYFVFNRLLYGNKTGKVLAYFKPFNAVVVRSQNKLSYFTFKEAFPKGGFYKTNTSKLMFGQQANLYSFDNDVIDVKLWVVPGVQSKSGFEGYLNEMGLLQNLPKNSTIIAVTILGVEFDISDFKVDEEKNYKSNLNDILVSFKEPKDSLMTCLRETKANEKALDISENKIALSFEYKITSKISAQDSKGKSIYETDILIYANKDNSITLQILDKSNTFVYTNRKLGQIIEGTYENGKLTMTKGISFDTKDCLRLNEKVIGKSLKTTKLIAGYDHEFGLFLLEKNSVDFPEFQNQITSNGFLSKRVYLNKDLEKQEYTSEIELGTFKFNLEK